ncbi:FAD-dependent oxidoreductase [Tahibacter caeni]|uniref:FAD-dependent oxidoreductase n=1 Tax=Tahibacter caeni TaxID=1453545 RepID=UPI0021491C49|nr:FAD-dependent oxidoreductase [Tahibacter caeni]
MNAQSRSLWMERQSPPLDTLVETDRDAQVCIVGAGIAGVSIALALAEAGQRVVVIDRAGIAGGETARTSAHLASALDDRFYRLERWHGADGAQLAARSHAAAIDRIEEWCTRYRIDCDFRRVPGYLVCGDPEHRQEFEREQAAAVRAGLAPERSDNGIGDLAGPTLRFDNQARFHPLSYLAGLVAAARAWGVRFVGAEAVDVDGGTSPGVTLADGSRIGAGAVVVAANVPFHRRFALHTKQAAYRTFVIAARVPAGSVPDMLLWDMEDPYHYVRLQPASDGSEWLIVGGADHKTGQEPRGSDPFGGDPFSELARWARQLCPGFGEPEYAWSGQIIEPIDGLAFIGADPGQRQVYVVSGDSGNGLTHGTLAAPLLTALIRGEGHAWRDLYDPARKRLNATWLEENANAAVQYRDWLGHGDAAAVAMGSGAVVRHGLHRFALYRDDNGELHAFSARCPHLGCVVHWNALERSWDCPCHGSRFGATDGQVLNGPAASGLDPLEVVGENRDDAA